MPTAESTEPVGSRPTCSLDLVDGTTRTTPTSAASATGGDEEDRAPVEPFEQRARGEDPERSAGAGEAGPDPDRLGALFRREHAGDRRQRARHDQRGADSHQRAVGDECRRVSGRRAERSRRAEDHQADDQRAATTEAVSERAGGQQERRERERVGIDDPLLLRLAGVETGREVGEAVGEHRDAGDDHHQREAHHREDRVAVGELRRWGRGRVRARSAKSFHRCHSLSRAPGGAAAGFREQYSDNSARSRTLFSGTIWRHPPLCKGVFQDDDERRLQLGDRDSAAPAGRRAAQLRPVARRGPRGVRRARAGGLARGDRSARRSRDRDALSPLPNPVRPCSKPSFTTTSSRRAR